MNKIQKFIAKLFKIEINPVYYSNTKTPVFAMAEKKSFEVSSTLKIPYSHMESIVEEQVRNQLHAMIIQSLIDTDEVEILCFEDYRRLEKVYRARIRFVTRH